MIGRIEIAAAVKRKTIRESQARGEDGPISARIEFRNCPAAGMIGRVDNIGVRKASGQQDQHGHGEKHPAELLIICFHLSLLSKKFSFPQRRRSAPSALYTFSKNRNDNSHISNTTSCLQKVSENN
jgi:hypothetical protein